MTPIPSLLTMSNPNHNDLWLSVLTASRDEDFNSCNSDGKTVTYSPTMSSPLATMGDSRMNSREILQPPNRSILQEGLASPVGKCTHNNEISHVLISKGIGNRVHTGISNITAKFGGKTAKDAGTLQSWELPDDRFVGRKFVHRYHSNSENNDGDHRDWEDGKESARLLLGLKDRIPNPSCVGIQPRGQQEDGSTSTHSSSMDDMDDNLSVVYDAWHANDSSPDILFDLEDSSVSLWLVSVSLSSKILTMALTLHSIKSKVVDYLRKMILLAPSSISSKSFGNKRRLSSHPRNNSLTIL